MPFRKDTLRAPWFWVSCCPTNVSRLLGSLSAHMANRRENGLDTHQFAPGTVSSTLEDGTAVRVRVETDYPWGGIVDVTVDGSGSGTWEIGVRVPEWAADGATVEVAGQVRSAKPGYERISRVWSIGDRLRLRLPLEPRLTWPDPRIDSLRRTVAVERGPLVYCLESPDFADPRWELDELGLLPKGSLGTARAGVGGDDTIAIVAPGARTRLPPAGRWPYGQAGASEGVDSVDLRLLPYYLWSNRGPSTMRVWIPVAERP